MKKLKIAIILGTRPEITKCAPVIRELIRKKISFFIIHTNQHFSKNMDEVFFKQLHLPKAKYNLGINATNHGRMVGDMLVEIERILLEEKPDWVLVQGDTNTVIAGALAASKIGIKVGHIEAGLRSYDRTMPEELNRVAADHFADLLFAPTHRQAMILTYKEGIPEDSVIVSGNTVVDAVKQNLVLAKRDKRLIHYKKENYFLLTMHRPSNVDTKEVFANQLDHLTALAKMYNTPIYYPIHPRALKQLQLFQLSPDQNWIKIMEPVDYMEMLMMMLHAKLIITDSGGVQEEACILRIPCITLRDNTERPETIDVGANIIVGTNEKKLIRSAKKMLISNRDWYNPFGDGRAAKKIVTSLLKH